MIYSYTAEFDKSIRAGKPVYYNLNDKVILTCYVTSWQMEQSFSGKITHNLKLLGYESNNRYQLELTLPCQQLFLNLEDLKKQDPNDILKELI